MNGNAVRFTLERNNFRRGGFYGCVVPRSSVDIFSIVRTLAPWIHEDDIAELLDRAGEEMLRHLKGGGVVTFSDFFAAEPFIEGTFTGEDDSFDPSRHVFRARICAGKKLSGFADVRLKKAAGARRARLSAARSGGRASR